MEHNSGASRRENADPYPALFERQNCIKSIDLYK